MSKEFSKWCKSTANGEPTPVKCKFCDKPATYWTVYRKEGVCSEHRIHAKAAVQVATIQNDLAMSLKQKGYKETLIRGRRPIWNKAKRPVR